jgi:hypothetical protein
MASTTALSRARNSVLAGGGDNGFSIAMEELKTDWRAIAAGNSSSYRNPQSPSSANPEGERPA